MIGKICVIEGYLLAEGIFINDCSHLLSPHSHGVICKLEVVGGKLSHYKWHIVNIVKSEFDSQILYKGVEGGLVKSCVVNKTFLEV